MQATTVDELKWTADWSTLTCRERELFVAVQVQLCLEWERLEAVDEELPAQSGDLLSERVQQQQFAQDDRPVPDHCIKLEVQAQTQALVENTQTHVCPSALVRWWDTGAILSLITCSAGRLMVSSSRRALVATAGFTSSMLAKKQQKAWAREYFSMWLLVTEPMSRKRHRTATRSTERDRANIIKQSLMTSTAVIIIETQKKGVLYWKQLIRICKAFNKEPLINKG